jgi:hypothetical protein
MKVHVCRLGAPAGGRVTRADRRAPADPRQPGNPVDPVVHDVPHAGQHGVDGRVRQRYRLGATRQCTDIRQCAAQLGQHRRVGLDRGDVGAQRNQRGGELAGAGAEVEHPQAGRGLERPANRGLRIVRAVLGVCGRRRAERRGMTAPFVLFHAITLAAAVAVLTHA